ncbi:MAG: ABC transporter permease [Oscillospiraceae bacterium]
MKKALKGLYLTLIVLFLYLPIGTLMVLSFNSGKTMNAWTGFSLDWYEEMFQSQQIMEALKNTLTIAFWAATIATVIGVAACIGLNSMREKSRSLLMGLNNIPLLNADIVTGISLMLSFLLFGISLNYGTVLFAHITFLHTVNTVGHAQIRTAAEPHLRGSFGFGSISVYAFFKVVLPDIMPGIISGFYFPLPCR